MQLYNIYDYEDFKYIFGLESHGNGVKSRKNKILLQHIKTPAVIRHCREHNDMTLLHIRNMADLKQRTLAYIQASGEADPTLDNKVQLIDRTFWSGRYRTDHLKGLCEDFDKRSVRYVNAAYGRVYKMRAGKFFASIIRETEIGKILSEQVVNWLSEEFAQDWATFTYGQTPEVELHVDDNFKLIYDEEACRHFNGCSCMVGKDRHSFYENSVDAKAAYLLDKEGYVLSRAILFTNVRDQYGKKWRLLERQYAKESNEIFKRLLIDLCIKGGHIDGYKQVGAGCSESRAFVANDGTSLSDKRFSIECNLATYDPLSYQDSFKYYNYGRNTAHNYPEDHYDFNLDTTDYNLDGDCDDEDEYDSYDNFHEYGCNETVEAYYHGQAYNVDVDNLDDFQEIEGVYYHMDDVCTCGKCGAWILKSLAVYNPEADSHYFCNEQCEKEYIAENFYYSEYDDAYFPSFEDITKINIWNDAEQCYKVITISKLSLQQLINSRMAFGADQTWFILNDAA